MSDSLELQDVAARVIAATEYFKSAGHLPSWARAELDFGRRETAAVEYGVGSPVLAAGCSSS
jgi:hypothetical protein